MKELKFGVEHEQFLLTETGDAPSHEQIEAMYDLLESKGWNQRTRNSNNQTLKVELQNDAGTIAVKNDYCTNILEIAYPPVSSPQNFRSMWLRAVSDLETVMVELSLKLHFGGSLGSPLTDVLIRSTDSDCDGRRARFWSSERNSSEPLFHRHIGACMCSTQVSLSVSRLDSITRLRQLYAFEYLVPLLFGNSPSFLGQTGKCMRHFMYLENLPKNYPLLAIPNAIPETVGEYEGLIGQCFRDYSYIVPHQNRLEFRSCCSQDSLDLVLQLVSMRLMVESATRRGMTYHERNARSLFEIAAIGKIPQADLINTDIILLEQHANLLDSQWKTAASLVIENAAAFSR